MSKKIHAVALSGLLLFASCTGERTVERITMAPTVLNDSIMTVMPGSIFLSGDYLLWTDPFAKDYFLQIHTLDGKELGVMGKVGKGPGEFVTPGVSSIAFGNRVFVEDLNGTTCGFLSIDHLLAGQEPFVDLPEGKSPSGMTQVDKEIFVGYAEEGAPTYFQASVRGKSLGFGVYPIQEAKLHIGGIWKYDSWSQQLVFASFEFPYLALYQLRDDIFQLEWEVRPEHTEYKLKDDRLIFDRAKKGIFEIALTKDYIVTLQRDYETDPMDESTVGRDASKCPHTVFLYDYKSNLVKVIDLGMPVMRITGSNENNVLYAIGVNPDFEIVKYEL